MTETANIAHPLADLDAFVAAGPAATWVAKGSSVVVYHSAHERYQLTREQCPFEPALAGRELHRKDVLAEAGICEAELDSASFAQGLVAALADNLSIRDLEALVAAFSLELATQEALRQQWRQPTPSNGSGA